jgi:putative transposase
MNEDKFIPLKNPGAAGPVVDVSTEVLRDGAQRMLVAAIEAEVAAFLERFQDEKTAEGRQRVVRNGRLPARSIQTGIGSVEVSVPAGAGPGEDDSVYLGDLAAVPAADQEP